MLAGFGLRIRETIKIVSDCVGILLYILSQTGVAVRVDSVFTVKAVKWSEDIQVCKPSNTPAPQS